MSQFLVKVFAILGLTQFNSAYFSVKFHVGRQLPTRIVLFGGHVDNIEYHIGKYFLSQIDFIKVLTRDSHWSGTPNIK